MLWTSEDIVSVTGGKLLGRAFEAGSVSIDSRTLPPGALFVAIEGEKFDGHDYLIKAKEAGAAGALVNYVPADAPPGLPLVQVKGDTLDALVMLAKASRVRTRAHIIGITGSVGKTSAKEMLKLALEPYGKVFASSGNYNNHVGLPLSLANMPADTDLGIFEMGMNHAGEIAHLTKIACPDVALITEVAAAHLEFFPSVEAIARAKAEIFQGMTTEGIAVLPADNAYFSLLKQEAYRQKIISFGQDDGSMFQLISAKTHQDGTQVQYRIHDEARSFILSTRGAHWPKIGLSVLAVVHGLGLALEKAERALAGYREQPGRGALLTLPWSGGEIRVIDDAYNASPLSMRAAIVTLGRMKAERKLAVLGEMRELGRRSAEFHKALAESLVAAGVEHALLVGRDMKSLAEALPTSIAYRHYDAVGLVPQDWTKDIQPNDLLLIKGSHGSGVYQLVEVLKAAR